MHILIVEDDRTIASGLQYSLEQEQFRTTLCQNVADATLMIEQQLHTIDLCLFDLSLPDGSGYDLCRLVKQQQDIPVIFLTAFDDEVNVVMGLDMGAEFVNDHTLTVYIKRLREKLEDDPQHPMLITTVRGIGYKVGR